MEVLPETFQKKIAINGGEDTGVPFLRLFQGFKFSFLLHGVRFKSLINSSLRNP
jgi:hypothetical protein